MDAGEDKFTTVTGVDGTLAIDYAEKIGLGTTEYELVVIE